jgi:hypothetical protein
LRLAVLNVEIFQLYPFEEVITISLSGKFAAILPNVCHLYGLLPVTMKMSMNGKHEKWNKTKKTSGIPGNWKQLML